MKLTDIKYKYYILYVENCSPRETSFKSIKQVRSFLREFKAKHGSLEPGDGYWIDRIYYGLKVAENKSFK